MAVENTLQRELLKLWLFQYSRNVCLLWHVQPCSPQQSAQAEMIDSQKCLLGRAERMIKPHKRGEKRCLKPLYEPSPQRFIQTKQSRKQSSSLTNSELLILVGFFICCSSAGTCLMWQSCPSSPEPAGTAPKAGTSCLPLLERDTQIKAPESL